MVGIPEEMVDTTVEKGEGQLTWLRMIDTVMVMDETMMEMGDTMLKLLHLQDRDEDLHVMSMYARHYAL